MKTMFYFLGSVLLCCPLLVASAEREINNSSSNHLVVTASSYANFLNAAATTDFDQLYEEKMGTEAGIASIVRSGQPGSYYYKAIDEESKEAITYLSYYEIGSYLRWLGALNKDVSSKIDPYLKINRTEFQINDISTAVAFQCSGDPITGSSLAEIIEEGVAIAALALGEGAERNQTPGHRVEERERVSPLVERQEAIEEQIVPVQEALLETTQAAPRKASVELTRRAFQVFFEHYLCPLKEKVKEQAEILLSRPIMTLCERGRIEHAKRRFIDVFEQYRQHSSDGVNYRLFLAVDQRLNALQLSIESARCYGSRMEEALLEKEKAAKNAANCLICSSECFKKFSEAKAAGQRELARALAHSAVYYDKAATGIIKGKPSKEFGDIAEELAKAEEKFAKADKKIAEYQIQDGDPFKSQKVMGMEFGYGELLVELAKKYKQALAAGNLPEAAFRWDAIVAIEKSLEYRRKASEKSNEIADLLMEVAGYHEEAAERFAAAQKNFTTKMGVELAEGHLMENIAKELEEAIFYAEKAEHYAAEAKGIKKQKAAIKNWASLQYQKAIQPKVVEARNKFLRELINGPRFCYYSLYTSESDDENGSVPDYEHGHPDAISKIEDVQAILEKEPSTMEKKLLPYFQHAIRYHENATKADPNMSEEERRCWHEVADRTNDAIYKFFNTNAAGRKDALKAAREASQLEKRALSLRSKNKIEVGSTNHSINTDAATTEPTIQLPVKASADTEIRDPNLVSAPLEPHAVIESKEQEESLTPVDAISARLANLKANLPMFCERANNPTSPGARLWKQAIDQIAMVERHLEKAAKTPIAEKATRLREGANKVIDAVEFFIQAAESKQRSVEACALRNPSASQNLSK